MSQDLAVRIEPDRPARDQSADRVVVYGDFNCPWSYLASRRAAMLAAAGVEVDWRAVEHDPWRPKRFTDSSTRFDCVQQEMDRVLAALLPGETLPYSLAGFVPYTRAAVSGYAEAYGAGVAARVRQLLFEAFWLHGFDLGAAEPVRTLLVDAIRSGGSTSKPLREWGYSVSVAGGPVTTTAWRLVTDWAAEWRAAGKETVPVLRVDGDEPCFGMDAVEWLGEELLRRGLEPGNGPRVASWAGSRRPVPPDPVRDLASLSWVSQHGNRWLRAYRDAHRESLYPSAC
jgi:2-hydroxychromene-2-carboxylate isomerase